MGWVHGFIVGFACCGAFCLIMHERVDCGRVEPESVVSKHAAVKAGHAEYVIIDPETGRTEFRWLPSRQEN
jgi:hypothetical protein